MLTLLTPAGGVQRVDVNPAAGFSQPVRPIESRAAYAAAHVVPKLSGDNVPGAPADIDWDATLSLRHHVWAWGLGVADAMDTAQRNMGLDWQACTELIQRSAADAAAVGGNLVVGINTDQVLDDNISLDDIIYAYLQQLEVAEEAGSGVVVMASRHLARAGASEADYERVYGAVLTRVGAPVVLHWLGDAFDSELRGYWGSTDVPAAVETVLRIIETNRSKVMGIKMSLLDPASEIAVRRRLPAGVVMFTGDDFNYVSLIEGDEQGHSDALLGAFAAFTPNASAAIQALDAGRVDLYRRILGPTEALSRHIFATPTQYYKTGVAFLSWLNGHQAHFHMVNGLHACRSLHHLSEIVRLANAAHALERPSLAIDRWHRLLSLHGVDE